MNITKLNLYLMIGVAGSGKSTAAGAFAQKHHTECVIISSDLLREVICGNVNDQSKNKQVFDSVRTMVEYFMLQGDRDIIVDATNLTKSTRKPYIELAKKHNVLVNAIYLPTTLEECKIRNMKRSRVVPEHVIELQHKKLEELLPSEFDAIILWK